MRFLFLLVSWSIVPAVSAQTLDFSGCLKNLYSYTRSPLTSAPHWQDLTRARLTLDGSAGSPERGAIHAHAEYDHELRAGTFLQSLDYRLFGLQEPASHFDLDQTLSTGGAYHYRHRLYRGWAAVEAAGWTARFGRQRVAWGTGKLWNPTDVLNPYPPTTLERDERRGVDAVYLRRAAGPLGQVEAAWALADRWAASDLLARVRSNARGADVSLVGGHVAGSTDSWLAGGDFAADVAEGNLHGEVAYAEPGWRTPHWKALIGYEYTFSAGAPPGIRDLYALLEYFHNGAGETDPRRYLPARLLSGREVGLARNYIGATLRKEPHPLLTAETASIVNIDDGGQFLQLSGSWNALTDLHLLAGLQRFAGPPRSEFGRLPNVAFLQAQYFF